MSKDRFIMLIAGILVVLAAFTLGGAPWQALLSPEAFIMVIGGTVIATVSSFKPQTIKGAINALKNKNTQGAALGFSGSMSPEDCMAYTMDVARFIRENGMLAIQPMLQSIELPFLRSGLSMVIDNCDEALIQSNLTTEIEVAYRQQLDYARVYETAGGYAPTMGIIGAVIGLMSVVQNLSNTQGLGAGVAGAFCATLLGVAVANLFLLPVAAQIRQAARDESFIKTMLTEAVMALARREHPLMLEEKLQSYVGEGRGVTSQLRPYASRYSLGQPSSRNALSEDTHSDIQQELDALWMS